MTAGGGEGILQSFATFLGRNLGLHFTPERLPDLEQRMAALGREQGCRNWKEFLVELMSAPLTGEQSDFLARVLTIGETYFLRDPKSYRALEEELLPRFVASGEKTLTILSAGCSSGEEPYSIAILLKRAIAELSQWKVTILGTDINPEALERARLGVYSKWSFRNAPPWLYDHFSRRDDGRFQISEEIRSMVRFQQLNLVDESLEGWPAGGVDIIFCRNVMLYFNAAGIRTAMQRFHAALKDNGWLFVGPTEVDHYSFRGFSCHHYDCALVLRKSPGDPFGAPLPAGPARAAQFDLSPAGAFAVSREPQKTATPPHDYPSPPPPALPPRLDAAPAPPGEPREGKSRATDVSFQEALGLYRSARYREAAELAIASAAGAEKGAALALAARSYANLGRFAEARESCQRSLEIEKLSAPNHYLLSIILEQLGEFDGAMQSLKRAIYIDHDFLLAYFALGSLCRRRGDRLESERNFSTALRLLERRHPHEVLPEADGMTAGRLAEMIRMTASGGG